MHCSDAMCDVYNCFAIRVLQRVRYLSRTPFIFTVSLIRKKFVAGRWNLFLFPLSLVERVERRRLCHPSSLRRSGWHARLAYEKGRRMTGSMAGRVVHARLTGEPGMAG